MAKFVVVDLETTGHTPANGDQIIEIGMVTIEDGKITDQFASFINPEQSIPPFITNLTGIKDEDVADAPLFREIVPEIQKRCQDAYFVAHHVQFDLGFLNQSLTNMGLNALHMEVLDTVELARFLVPSAPGYKLSQLAEYYQFSHNDPHRALADAYVTAELLIALLNKAKQLPIETLEQLLKLEKRFISDFAPLLEEWIDEKAFVEETLEEIEIYRGLAIRKQKKEPEKNREIQESFGDFLDEIFGKDGYLKQHLTNYEARPGQREMAETIFDAFQSKKHSLIEAETGTGKSLAYLIPSVYQALKTNKRIMISTHTTQLQAQLLEKELPLLQEILPYIFQVALIKGKSHYLSLKKFEMELDNPQSQDNYDTALAKAIILVWLTETETGDVDEIQLPSSGKIFWRRVSAEAEGYTDPKSPWFSKTFFQRAKQKAQKADIVVTNHALLCTDLLNDYQLLPSYKYVIVDEAHHLEAIAAKHFGLKLDYVSLQYVLNELGTTKSGDWIQKFNEVNTNGKVEKEWDALWYKTKEEADELFRYIFSYVSNKRSKDISLNDVGRYQYRFDAELNSSSFAVIQEMASRLIFNIRDLIHFLWRVKGSIEEEEPVEEVDWTEEVQIQIDKLQEVIDVVEELLLKDDSDQVKWMEIEAYGAKNAVFLYSEPVDIAPLMAEQFFAVKDSVVLTSATLTMQNSFHFMIERIGLTNQKPIEKKLASPFAYESQVQLFIPNDFPDIKYGNQDEFIYATCEAIYSLAQITKGRMLVLFTSYDMLKKAYTSLKEFIEEDEFVLIAQGISSGSRSRLKKNFQAFDQAILFGTSSFWEGVDIPGDDLTSLVIVRLPFQPPDHPVFEAKSEQLKQQGKNPFMELSLPNAVIRFKQGFGRLIRSSTDRGIVFVCDQRLMKTRYGKYFTESIPKVPTHYQTTTELLKKAEQWL